MNNKLTILIVEDEDGHYDEAKELIEEFFADIIETPERAKTSIEAIETYERRSTSGNPFDIILLDLVKLDKAGGGELVVLKIAEQEEKNRRTKVVLMSAQDPRFEAAERLLSTGAVDDFIRKSFIREEFRFRMRRIIEELLLERQIDKLRDENRQLRKDLEGSDFEPPLIGSLSHGEFYDIIRRGVVSDCTVLIQGETGVGKEVVAKKIHHLSPRCSGTFLPVNCGALPETLLESELFGHIKGAFTGAYKDEKGKFLAANGGTIFLDEITAAPPSLQVKLLRVLQDKQIIPVGSNKLIKVDVRVIAASNKDVDEEVRNGRFREDLYYRLNVLTVFVPPLRERLEDIEPLVQYFIDADRCRMKCPVERFSSDAIQFLRDYDWPGNVRELQSTVHRSMMFCDSSTLLPEHIKLLPKTPPQRQSIGGIKTTGWTFTGAGITTEWSLAYEHAKFTLIAIRHLLERHWESQDISRSWGRKNPKSFSNGIYNLVKKHLSDLQIEESTLLEFFADRFPDSVGKLVGRLTPGGQNDEENS